MYSSDIAQRNGCGSKACAQALQSALLVSVRRPRETLQIRGACTDSRLLLGCASSPTASRLSNALMTAARLTFIILQIMEVKYYKWEVATHENLVIDVRCSGVGDARLRTHCGREFDGRGCGSRR